MKYDVLNRFTGAVQFTSDIDCYEISSKRWKLRLAALWALENKVDLIGADLRYADLRYANFGYANFRDANFRNANFRGANFRNANFRGADFRGAKFVDAKFADADFRGAKFGYADFRGADFRGADLIGANFWYADLRGANFGGAKNIITFGPVGKEFRIGYVHIGNDNKPMILLGCHYDNADKTVEKIRKKYGDNSTYEAFVIAAVNEILNNDNK